MFTLKTRKVHQWGALGLILLLVILTPLSVYGESAESDDAIHVDADGRVGVGTPSPEAELDVAGQTKLDGAVGIGTTPDAGQQLTIQPAGNQAPLRVTGPGGKANWMTISPQGDVTMQGGKVGIGTGEPEAQLDVNGDVRISKDVKVGGDTTFGRDVEVKGGLQVDKNLQVGGDARVNGNLTQSARYQRDDQPESRYEISPRYHLSLTAKNYGGKTKTIPQSVVQELCADPDGCQVRLAMTGWGPGEETRHASVFFTFYYSSQTGLWRASSTDAGDASGKDNDGATQHVRNIWSTCYLTDGNYNQYRDQGDRTIGMQLLVWNGYNHPARTCECTLID